VPDFDELLLRDEFKCVEKIKTIGSTYMCASGLDATYRSDSYEHLYALLDFAVAMQNAIESFNRDLLEFNLVLRIGFNYGEVTAGVIGTTKLHYDIWGEFQVIFYSVFTKQLLLQATLSTSLHEWTALEYPEEFN
jgi:adenylate cyclase 9